MFRSFNAFVTLTLLLGSFLQPLCGALAVGYEKRELDPTFVSLVILICHHPSSFSLTLSLSYKSSENSKIIHLQNVVQLVLPAQVVVAVLPILVIRDVIAIKALVQRISTWQNHAQRRQNAIDKRGSLLR